ncbi:sugar phosphate nucleotidyltransferase [Ancylobacter sp. A5.8]|uniref:sugar phosphate nucleotidyltransferase n=1 Tax=Ancylobacter gelatini TaxID=2919920 RepID=UPI001F4ED744|nr:sugar phosphate nucleotidyltransferase [Ancylobacter gelatini]MCJ8145228.1 sugar phosphate nucleotidyltransferase [Ancylobacter gelatini]
MKVILFCGGLGTRIREYSESVPKPMIPVGGQPILWHVMDYYSRFGHRDFVLCLGYKANVVKEFFLNHRPEIYSDLVVCNGGATVDILGEKPVDWRMSLVDTGVWRNIGSRLWAVRHLVQDEEMFLANYSDGLSDAPLDEMIETFKRSGKVACFLAVHPMLTFHLAQIDDTGRVREMQASDAADMWINGGYFIFRKEIFDYMRDGEELVVEPFARLIKADQLLAYKYEGFWRAMDTLKDRQSLEDMIEKGQMPWRRCGAAPQAIASRA